MHLQQVPGLENTCENHRKGHEMTPPVAFWSPRHLPSLLQKVCEGLRHVGRQLDGVQSSALGAAVNLEGIAGGKADMCI